MPDANPETPRQNLRPRPRPWEILALLPLGTLIGGLLGAGFGFFNSWLIFVNSGPLIQQMSVLAKSTGESEIERRVNQLKLEVLQTMINREAMWRMNLIKRSITYGWCAGLVISLLLVIGIALISKLRCPFRTALGIQLKVVRFAFLLWLVGGINALIAASVAPQWFWRTINSNAVFRLGSISTGTATPEAVIEAWVRGSISTGTATPELLREAWVWGSIWGFRAGLMLATIGCLVSFANQWRKLEAATRENRIAEESHVYANS